MSVFTAWTVGLFAHIPAKCFSLKIESSTLSLTSNKEQEVVISR